MLYNLCAALFLKLYSGAGISLLEPCFLHFSAALHMSLPMEQCRYISAVPMAVSYVLTHNNGQDAGATWVPIDDNIDISL